MKPLLEILETVGATQHDIENWQRQLELHTIYQDTVRGRPRLFSRDNVLELAALAAFAKCGIRVGAAAPFAYAVVRHSYHAGGREFMVFAAGNPNPKEATGTNEPGAAIESIAKQGNPPAAFAICVGEIVRRVDKLFEAD